MNVDRCRPRPRFLMVRPRFLVAAHEAHPAPCTGAMAAPLLAGLCCAALSGCGGGGTNPPPAPAPPPPADYTAFGNPELVTIVGYSGDAMEPFVSRDGTYLFFNDDGADKNIFYAAFINPTSTQYQGPIASINTNAVDGTPTMDTAARFFYISTANYNPPTAYDTLYSGTWNGSSVTGSAAVSGLARTTAGAVNFDVEVSADGATLYFVDGVFSGSGFPDSADIAIAVASGGGFVRDPQSSAILADVNTTTDLEYAPAISADGRELFFTGANPGASEVRIYRAVRNSTSAPFAAPQLVSAITGFVEGPALSPDEKSLYYHRRNTATGRFEIYRVTRP